MIVKKVFDAIVKADTDGAYEKVKKACETNKKIHELNDKLGRLAYEAREAANAIHEEIASVRKECSHLSTSRHYDPSGLNGGDRLECDICGAEFETRDASEGR